MSFKYLTISDSGESLYKVKGSKHFGYVFHVKTEEDINKCLDQVRVEHHSARHVCYAWRLGADKERFRANDDGEPANSAGKPILGQIEKYDLTNVLIAVVRYFGGTKLGVGGLIDAYRTAASEAIDNATIIERQLCSHYRLHFGYEDMSDVMRIIRTQGWENFNHNFTASCTIELSILPEDNMEIENGFNAFDDIRIEKLGIY